MRGHQNGSMHTACSWLPSAVKRNRWKQTRPLWSLPPRRVLAKHAVVTRRIQRCFAGPIRFAGRPSSHKASPEGPQHKPNARRPHRRWRRGHGSRLQEFLQVFPDGLAEGRIQKRIRIHGCTSPAPATADYVAGAHAHDQRLRAVAHSVTGGRSRQARPSLPATPRQTARSLDTSTMRVLLGAGVMRRGSLIPSIPLYDIYHIVWNGTIHQGGCQSDEGLPGHAGDGSPRRATYYMITIMGRRADAVA